MKKLIIVLVSMWMFPAVAATSGVITFNGSIVVAPCSTASINSQLNVSCNQASQTNIRQINLSQAQQSLPDHSAQVSIESVHNAKIVKFDYL
ncbi:hypothetical protein [Pantoea sp. SOD02]|uniref:hypothetical protein n=1 Tax=Pantoea sp. SOD02 TaxID=2970818 RepID=UPI0021579A24|nr:hypothetical protein [Pantoea sp. SOD02]UVC29817.1 hypothetical protein NR302_02215 [Pantoea sp. SOD02]